MVTTKSSNADAHGNGGESGAPTSITGPDLSFETPGGVGGTVGRMQSRFSADGTMYEFFVTNAASSGGTYPGGGAAQNGARGLMGAGGAAGVEGYSGGGGGSIGSGGIGGKPENSGADGGICAGGGGAGFLRSNDSNSAGGNGGVGSLTLVSVATGEEER